MATNFGKLNFAVAFNPQTAFPLDARSYFESYESAVVAAAGAKEAGSDKSTYFYGQTVVVKTSSKATLYIIQPDNTLQEVGSTSLGDGKSIEVVNGKIQLKGFGNGYYKYNPEVEGKYTFVSNSFKEGLEPRVVYNLLDEVNGEFSIAWYEPNPELENRIKNIEDNYATKKYVQDTVAEAITGSEDGILIKLINEEQFELSLEGELSLKSVSTDLLVQGTKTLVLGGGSSKE